MAVLTEADTCQKYVLPKLYAAGGRDDQISEQRSFTDGRIVRYWRQASTPAAKTSGLHHRIAESVYRPNH